jgi:hypothetical protein
MVTATIMFDDGQYGQDMLAKLSRQFARPNIDGCEATWTNPSGELIDQLNIEFTDDDWIFEIHLIKSED